MDPEEGRMKLPKSLEHLEEISPWKILCLVSGAAIALAVFLDRVQKLKGDFESVLFLGIEPAAPPPIKQGLTTWLFLLLLAICVLTVCLALLFVWAELRRRASVRTLDERKTRAYATLQGMMRAGQRIRTQSYPNATRHKVFRRIHLRYLLDREFTARVTRTYSISAVNGPVHFWQESYRVRDEADATEYLLDIDFKVRDISGRGDVVYLPTEIDGRSKAVSLYFLPQITPDEAGRIIEVSYKWPGLARSLRRLGEESFNFNYDSLESVDEVTLEIFLEAGTGGKLYGEISGEKYPGSNIAGVIDGDTMWDGIRYSCSNSPAGQRVVHSVLVKWRSD